MLTLPHKMNQGDEVLTLSACAYHLLDGRLLVIAKEHHDRCTALVPLAYDYHANRKPDFVDSRLISVCAKNGNDVK